MRSVPSSEFAARADNEGLRCTDATPGAWLLGINPDCLASRGLRKSAQITRISHLVRERRLQRYNGFHESASVTAYPRDEAS